MRKPRKPVTDPVLKKWLTEFKKPTTRRSYTSSIRKFKQLLGIEDLGEYLRGEPDTDKDIKNFLIALEGRPSKSIAAYLAAVKVFLQDHDVPLNGNNWRKLKRRGFIPKKVRAETRDKKPTKTMLKKILNYVDIKGRAMILFLVSSGARIGETLQLKAEDLDLESEPPKAIIRNEYTKSGVGGRTAFFSYEARDAIRDWLRIKDNMGKRSGGTYEDPRIFPWSDFTARFIWNSACAKAGLDQKDTRTNRRVFHLHSLRKFFRTNISLNLNYIHALMGHSEYLDDAYLRQEQKDIAEAYLEAMPNVSVYAIENTELKQETQNLKEEIQKLRTKEKTKDEKIAELEQQLEYVRSPKFTENIIEEIKKTEFTFPEPSKKPVKIHQVKVKLDDGKKLAKLMREGYTPTYSDNEIWILEKETED
jgi:integrase